MVADTFIRACLEKGKENYKNAIGVSKIFSHSLSQYDVHKVINHFQEQVKINCS
jgi:hypothetical protein